MNIAARQAKPLPFAQPSALHTQRRRVVNGLAIGLTTLGALFPVVILVYVLGYILAQGRQFLNLAFFTELPGAFGSSGGGIGEAIQGSLILVGLASLVGIPLGLFTGIFLVEYHHTWFATAVRFIVDVLVGIPTIIFGVFIWALVVIPQHSFSALAGSLSLGIIMIPIITRAAEEVLRLVPEQLREAALALGIPQWRVLLQIILPSVSGGIVTGIVLAMARIAGETAPLLMTASVSPFFFHDLNSPIDALPTRIYYYTNSSYQVQINQAYAGAFVLIALVVLASVLVRWATGGFRRQAR
jgi:phosphate transport system permease protein